MNGGKWDKDIVVVHIHSFLCSSFSLLYVYLYSDLLDVVTYILWHAFIPYMCVHLCVCVHVWVCEGEGRRSEQNVW